MDESVGPEGPPTAGSLQRIAFRLNVSRLTIRYWLMLLLLLGTGVVAAAPEVRRSADRLVATGNSGEVAWTRTFGYRLFRPLVTLNRVFVTGVAGSLLALDRDSGRRLWRFETGDDWLYPPVLVGGRLVVVGRSSGLHGLSPADGREVWHLALPQEPTEGPVAGGDKVLQGLFSGDLLAVSPASGAVIWQTRLGSPPLHVAAAHGRVVTGGYDAMLRALSLEDGRLSWRVTLPARVALRPLLRKAHLVVATERPSLMLIDSRNGRVLDRLSVPREVLALETLKGDGMVVALRAGKKQQIGRVLVDRGPQGGQPGLRWRDSAPPQKEDSQ